MGRSGARRARVFASQASPRARSTGTARRVTPAPPPIRSRRAIISCGSSENRRELRALATSLFAVPRCDAFRRGARAATAQPPSASRRARAISPARWCARALPRNGTDIGAVIAATGRHDRSGGNMKHFVFTALAAGGALAMSVPASADYVSANILNCRAGPAASEAVVAKLDRGQNVDVAERSGTWSRLAAPDCWVLTRYLSDDEVASSSTRPSSLYGPSTSGSSSYGLTSPPSARASAKKKPRSSKRRSSSSQSGCPCSGSQVCIGPRGGRYCITGGGNKRYGV